MHAKLEKGVGIAKIDSLQICIPVSECIQDWSEIGETTYEITRNDTLVKERPNKPSRQFSKDGIIFDVSKRKPIKNVNDKNDYPAEYVYSMPSKILGVESYDEGWTLENFERGTAWMENLTGIKFKPYAWANARFSDLESTIDRLMTAQQWSEELNGHWNQIEPATRKEFGKLFKQPNGLVSGFQLNSRKKEGNRPVTANRPFFKAYDKEVEVRDARAVGDKWAPDYEPGDRKRFEIQIRNNQWIKYQTQRPLTWAELMTLYRDQNKVMEAQIYTALQKYTVLPERKFTKRDMKQENAFEFMFRELIELGEENRNMPAGQEPRTMEQMIAIIKLRAQQAFHRQKAWRIAKELDKHWEIMKPETDPNQKRLEI